jgi:hypothetical protein
MTDQNTEECPSKKSWSEIIGGSLKKIIWKSADGLGEEAGRSVGKLIFFGVLVLIGLWLLSTALAEFTSLFNGWFDWIPNPFSWFGGGEESTQASTPVPTVTDPEKEPGWICSRWTKWNPGC